MEALTVYTVNIRGPHGRLACLPAKCVPPENKDFMYYCYFSQVV